MVEGTAAERTTEEGPFAQMSITVTLYRLAHSKSPLQANWPSNGYKEMILAFKKVVYVGRVDLSLHHILVEKSTWTSYVVGSKDPWRTFSRYQ